MMRDLLCKLVQNKNAVMFITSIVFMGGILAYFNDNVILSALIITIFSICFIVKNFVPLKLILLWVLIFYLGFLNASLRINATDDLVSLANQKIELSGQIVSIPNSSDNLKSKFFFKVFQADGYKVKGKTLVTVTSDVIEKCQIGDFYIMIFEFWHLL